MSRSVLLVTHSDDHFTIDRVADGVRRRGARPIRVDSDTFPHAMTLTLPAAGLVGATLTVPHERIALDEVEAVWVRRMWAGRALEGKVDARFVGACFRESRALFRAMLARLESQARVVNGYEATLAAEEKPRQLDVARALGFDIPATVHTNDPDAVRAFFDAHEGRVVTKLQGALTQSMQPQGDFLYTSRVARADLTQLEGLSLAPQVFQEEIDKVRELRVVVVGDRVFTGAIDTRSLPHAAVDWRRARMSDDVNWEHASLDDDTARRACALVHTLGLVTGALDFIESTAGRLVFLEVNPAGEWGFLESELGLPIGDALAGALLDDATQRSAP
jgi:glutathione synthase/RimK-type ligase-like ATP-grasp enzyme